MKTQKTIRSVVAIVTAVFLFNTPAGAISYTTHFLYGPYTGSFSAPTITQTDFNLDVRPCRCQSGEVCYRALTGSGYTFHFASEMELPEVGLVVEDADGRPGLFDQTFQNTTRTHEEWHYEYAWVLAKATYGLLEKWSDSYVGGCFHSAAAALAAANLDMVNALITARAAFEAEWPNDVPFERAVNSHCRIEDINGTMVWRSTNANWGNMAVDLFGKKQTAIDYASSVTVAFTTTRGDCVCVPESGSSWVMLCLGIGFVMIQAHRRDHFPGQG